MPTTTLIHFLHCLYFFINKLVKPMIVYFNVLFRTQPKDILSERRKETRNYSHGSKWNQRIIIFLKN